MSEDRQQLPVSSGKGLAASVAESLMARLSPNGSTLDSLPNRSSHRTELITSTYQTEGVSFAFEAFGLCVGVSVADRGLLDEIVDRLPIGWEPASLVEPNQHFSLDRSVEPRRYRLTNGDGDLLANSGRDEAADSFESALEDYIALHAKPWIFLHAGVVGWQGRAILIPAQSFAGKSTLTAALVAAGAAYYSDEYAVFDPDGFVHPFPRPISLRTSVRGAWKVRRVDALGVQHDDLPPLPVGLVALLSYDPDLAFRVETLDRGEAVMALCEHSVAIRRRPADVFGILQAVIDSAQVIRGTRGEAEEAAANLLAMANEGHP